MGIFEAAGAFCKMIAEGLGLVRDRNAQKNTAAVQAAVAAQKEAKEEDNAKLALKNNDLEEIRKQDAE